MISKTQGCLDSILDEVLPSRVCCSEEPPVSSGHVMSDFIKSLHDLVNDEL